MKTTEKRARAKRIRTNIQQYILDLAVGTSLLAIGTALPKVARHLQPKMNELAHRDRTNMKIKRAFNQLIKRGELEMKERNGKKYVAITNKGRLRMMRLQAALLQQQRPKWDKRWRIVTYDIKEYRRGARSKVIDLLHQFGFQKLQASVWVYPYPCEELVMLLKTELKLGKSLLYVIAEELEQDTDLRRKFNLPC